MMAHRCDCIVRSSIVQLCDDGFVFGDHLVHMALHRIGQMADAVKMRLDALNRRPYAFQSGANREAAVKLFIRRVKTPGIAIASKSLLAPYRFGRDIGTGLRPVNRSFAQDRKFQRHAGEMTFPDLLQLDRRHETAALRKDVDQPVFRQPGESNAHRRTRNCEHAADAVLAHRLARPEMAGDDGIAYHAVDLIRGRKLAVEPAQPARSSGGFDWRRYGNPGRHADSILSGSILYTSMHGCGSKINPLVQPPDGRNVMKSTAKIAAAVLFGLAGSTAALADPDTKVALVPGGPHPYFAAWEQAGKDAMKDFNLGAGDYRVPQKWELSQQSQLLESLLTQGYNSFLIFPGDAVGTNSVVSEIVDNGGQAIATAGCLKDPTPALFCMGTDTGNSAYLGTKELIKAMGGKGRIAHFTGFLVDPNTQLRIDAVQKAADETNGAVTVVQVIADIDAPQPAEEKINAYLAAHAADVDGIVTTAWVPAVTAANSLRKIGDKRIKMVGIDHDEVVLQAIKDGFVDGTMLQNPYGQGYIGSYVLDKLRHGCSLKDDAPWKSNALTAKFVDSGTVFVNAAQVDTYVDAMRGITKDILANFAKDYMNCQ